MEIKRHNNDRLHFIWAYPGVLLYRPMNLRDGHGLVLTGTAYLEGADLRALLSSVTATEQEAA